MNFGIVVEGDRDAAAYGELIRKLRQDIESVVPIPCGGASQVIRKFVGWLKHFEWHSVLPVHKALVIIDSDCSDPASWETQLERIYEQSHFVASYPVSFHATRCELETWLLADETAIEHVSRARGKNRPVAPPPIDLESYKDAKDLFQMRLSEARLPADPKVYEEVAAASDINRVAARCAHFRQFITKVRS